MKLLITIAALILVCLGLAIVYGKYRWQIDTATLRAKLTSGQQAIQPKFYSEDELEGLPIPVQRFFRKVLKNGQPMIARVRLSQQGQFNMKETEAKWNPFTATQVFTTQPPGFDWDARIQMAPGLNAFVHDAYMLGKGSLLASLLGLFTLANVRGGTEANIGELMRFFAEAAWYPTALLPSQGVRWEEIDATSARGILMDGDTTVSLVFGFNTEGLIDTIHAAARYRDKVSAMPWGGRFWEYTIRNGMLIPLRGEVGWEYPEGMKLYYKGQITDISHEFAI
jgi:hypothetical protein